MTWFEYLSVFLSVIMGLGVTHILIYIVIIRDSLVKHGLP